MHSLQNVSRLNIGRWLTLCIMLTKCQTETELDVDDELV